METRASIVAGGGVAIVGMPLWSAFDYLVAPDQALRFTIYRLLATVVIGVCWALLFTPFGRRRPEWLGLGMLGTVQIAIALMVVQLTDNLPAYALRMSLAIYASAFLLVWQLRYTLALVAISVAALAVGWALTPEGVGGAQVATVAFYLLTASVISVAGQVVRDRGAWREFEIKTELQSEQARTRELVAKLDRLSHEDPLTGLANRRSWDEVIARECARVDRAEGTRTLAVLLCDVDRLKEINDTLGHAMGDVVLKAVADLLRTRIRAADIVARIGGDEFAILAVDSDEVQAATLAEDLRALIHREQPGGPSLGSVSVSVGVAGWDGADDSPGTLMLRADRRLYAAKARRNVVVAGDPIEPVG